jgi:hypothetical protein
MELVKWNFLDRLMPMQLALDVESEGKESVSRTNKNKYSRRRRRRKETFGRLITVKEYDTCKNRYRYRELYDDQAVSRLETRRERLSLYLHGMKLVVPIDSQRLLLTFAYACVHPTQIKLNHLSDL